MIQLPSKNSFKNGLFSTDILNFNDRAIKLFQVQAENNLIYKEYLELLKVSVHDIDKVDKIPCMPISFFKNHKILTGNEKEKLVFFSSGTTGQERSAHYVQDPTFYEAVSVRMFEQAYGNLTDFVVLALLPSYTENKNSSLVYMVEHFIHRTGSRHSSFLTLNDSEAILWAKEANPSKKLLLIGVTYALLEMAELACLQLAGTVIMETGGMKGRGIERPREEVHKILKQKFNVSQIHSEYGMTELLSQAYAQSDGIFSAPPWMRVSTREINDPFAVNNKLSSGGLNIIDLANIDSCAFIETQDIGKVFGDGTFAVLGRMDNSETRGCNLLSLS